MLAVGSLWGRVEPLGDWQASWRRQLPTALALVSAAQLGAAKDGAATVSRELEASGFPERRLATVDPRAFVGWPQHAPGSTLAEVLHDAPLIAARAVPGDDVARLAVGAKSLEAVTQMMVSDAGRAAAQAQGVATERTVATWFDPPPYCPRCAVMIGKRVKLGTQFQRHPRCDGSVQHMSERDPRTMSAADLDDIKGLTKAERQALEDGADLGQVVNAKRGRARGGSKLRNCGTQTLAGARRGQVRLTPKGIYQLADGDRDQALTLLRKHGYVGQ